MLRERSKKEAKLMSAKLRLLMNLNESLREIIYYEKNEAEKKRIIELDALEKEEAEKNLRRRTEAAIIIQKHWRGFIGRKYYKECLLRHFRQISLKHYNSMATMIQKVWRGNWIRKNVYNYHKRKEYFQALVLKNEKMLTQLKVFREERQRIQLTIARNFQKQQQIDLASKYHHLVSTKSIPGIYNSPYRPSDYRDPFLKSARFNTSPYLRKRKQLLLDATSEKLNSLKTLPKLPPKPQGPFRDPQDVQLQRYKQPLETLRMETDFYHLEEARKEMMAQESMKRINHNIFLPVSGSQYQYQRNMHRMSDYIPLGKESFRNEDSSLNICKQDFKLVVSPVDLFDQFQERNEDLKLKELLNQSQNMTPC